MKNYVQRGEILDFIAPYAVNSGDGFLVGSVFAVTEHDAANGAAVRGMVEGVVTLPKPTAQAWTVGLKLYWDNTAKNVTSVSTSNTLIGFASVAALAADTTGTVRLNGTVS